MQNLVEDFNKVEGAREYAGLDRVQPFIDPVAQVSVETFVGEEKETTMKITVLF